MSQSNSSTPSCIFLVDMARTRSHLFFRYLSTHPKVQPMWHPFLPPGLFGPERLSRKTKNRRDEEWIAPPEDGGPTYASAEKEFLDALETAKKEGKVFVANEHSQFAIQQEIALSNARNQKIHLEPGANPTYIPDHVMETLQPIFVIRHPVFRVPSAYISFAKGTAVRPGDEDFFMICDLSNQRYIFEYFKTRTGKAPIVVDGDDVVWRTEELAQALGKALHLDPAGFSDTWDVVPEEERSEWPVIRMFLTTIDASTGVERGTAGRPVADLEAARKEWVEEYGEEVAKALEKTVQESLPTYEYMKQFAI